MGFEKVFSHCGSKRVPKEPSKKILRRDSVIVPNGMEKYAGISNSRYSILWVGNIRGVKNPEIFINLAKDFPNEKFVMVALF